jgi:hypothetical protein
MSPSFLVPFQQQTWLNDCVVQSGKEAKAVLLSRPSLACSGQSGAPNFSAEWRFAHAKESWCPGLAAPKTEKAGNAKTDEEGVHLTRLSSSSGPG